MCYKSCMNFSVGARYDQVSHTKFWLNNNVSSCSNHGPTKLFRALQFDWDLAFKGDWLELECSSRALLAWWSQLTHEQHNMSQ